MKMTLILALLLAGAAWAAEKKADVRQGPKVAGEKDPESITSDEAAGKTLSPDVHAAQNRAQQLESKKARQFQEERPDERD